MFSRLSIAFIFVLAVFSNCATALITITVTQPPVVPVPASTCNAQNHLRCCQSIQNPNEGLVTTILGLLGVVLGGVGLEVGINCTTVSLIGGGITCSGQAVCCQNNSYNSLISIGCSPINVNL